MKTPKKPKPTIKAAEGRKENQVAIYALLCPHTDRVRYIGKSVNPEKRLQQHIGHARHGALPSSRWIRRLLRDGARPRMEIVAWVPPEQWEECEMVSIRHFRERCDDLLNLADGGARGFSDQEQDPGREREVAAAMLYDMLGRLKTYECWIETTPAETVEAAARLSNDSTARGWYDQFHETLERIGERIVNG